MASARVRSRTKDSRRHKLCEWRAKKEQRAAVQRRQGCPVPPARSPNLAAKKQCLCAQTSRTRMRRTRKGKLQVPVSDVGKEEKARKMEGVRSTGGGNSEMDLPAHSLRSAETQRDQLSWMHTPQGQGARSGDEGTVVRRLGEDGGTGDACGCDPGNLGPRTGRELGGTAERAGRNCTVPTRAGCRRSRAFLDAGWDLTVEERGSAVAADRTADTRSRG